MCAFFHYFTAIPGPPTDLTVNEVEIHKIHLNWKRPNYFTVTGYQVEINQESRWELYAQVRVQGLHLTQTKRHRLVALICQFYQLVKLVTNCDELTNR